jgi:hypothetical protein
VRALPDTWDDEELLSALREAVRARQAVPADFVETAKSVFAWHNIDAELAELTYDSFLETADASTTRAEVASIRSLTFSSQHLSIELEVQHESLLGQLVPPQPGTLTVQVGAGEEAVTTTADDIGCFSIGAIPSGPFRLRCQTASGIHAVTVWVTVRH